MKVTLRTLAVFGRVGGVANPYGAKSATLDLRLRATRAARPGLDICKRPGLIRTFVTIGILKKN